MHACPLCRENCKPETAPLCSECVKADAAQRRSFKFLRNRLAVYRYTLWKERKIRGRPPWTAGDRYTPYNDREIRDLDTEWTHPALTPGDGERDALLFHCWCVPALRG